MVGTQQTAEQLARCTLCPAGCQLRLASAGPDTWRAEYSLRDGAGLCPRGSTLCELLAHRLRIVAPARRRNGQTTALSLADAAGACIEAAGDGAVTILLDGNIPCEEMVAAAEWCRSWKQASLCLVVEPAEEQMLLGLEASGADYLAAEDLSGCDGFVIIGAAFEANPVCSRGVFDRRRAEPRTPLVTIDASAGTAAKFATHRICPGVGEERSALEAVAAAAGLDVPSAAALPWAAEAGQAIKGCRRLGVILSAEYGRTGAWAQIGQLAGRLARKFGGGVSAQTTGANALAAVRLGSRLGTVPLATALSGGGVRIAIGADVLGSLGWLDGNILAAAAPLANPTTEAAEIILPVAMPGELAGTYLLDAARAVEVAAVAPPPAGVPTPAELVGALAAAAGVAKPAIPDGAGPLERVSKSSPASAEVERPDRALLLGRQAMHSGCGSLTAHGEWQALMEEVAELRLSPAAAAAAGVAPLATVTVRVGAESVSAHVRVAPELEDDRAVLLSGDARARTLLPARINEPGNVVVAGPAAFQLDV